MIDGAYVQRMARYNRWQNENLYGVAEKLSDDERRRERGAFFGSIQKTLSHILWADQAWMNRLAATPKPPGAIVESVSLYPDWDGLKSERKRFDETIIAWAGAVAPAWLEEEQTFYLHSLGRELTKPRWVFVTHMFNHQTHHRGQVHSMLTQAGGKPGRYRSALHARITTAMME